MNWLLIIIYFGLNLIPFSSSSNKLTSKFKLLKGSGTKPKVIDVEKEEDLEYPRKNVHILKKVEKLWSDYYDCLLKKADEDIKPEIVRIIEGLNIELKCDACIQPFQDFEEFEWKYKTISVDSNNTELENLELTPEMELTPKQILKIFNAVESLEGLYVCYQGQNVVSLYILEIVKNDTIEQVSNLTSVSEIIPMENVKLEVYYKWGEWSECNSCENVGKMFNYGFCFISVREMTADWATKLNARYTKENLFSYNYFKKNIVQIKEKMKNSFKVLAKEENKTENREDYKNYLKESYDVIAKFKTGIPCTSAYVPFPIIKYIFRYKAVKTAIKYCRVPCDESELFEVIDKEGNIVEIANNSAGIYSVFQDIPKIFPEIERKSVTAEFGTDIILQCPGTLYKNIPVTWKTNKKIIFPEIVANESKGRFTIDLINRIEIKNLRIKDSRIYSQFRCVVLAITPRQKIGTSYLVEGHPKGHPPTSCWNRDKLLGTVHLIVEKKFRIGFDHHITLLGILAVIGTFLYVLSKLLTRELKSRKR